LGEPGKGEALSPAKVGPPVQGNMGGRKGDGWGNTCMGEGGGREWGLMYRKPGRGIMFEM